MIIIEKSNSDSEFKQICLKKIENECHDEAAWG